MLWDVPIHKVIKSYYNSLWSDKHDLIHIMDPHIILIVEDSGEFTRRYVDRDLVISYLVETTKQATNIKTFSISYSYQEIEVNYKHFDSNRHFRNIFKLYNHKITHITIIIE